MAAELEIAGRWPSPIEIGRGWSRAEARTWNDDFPDGFVRLIRGSSGFLRDVSERLAELAESDVYSPALLESARRVWVRSGYAPAFDLSVMERSVEADFEPAPDVVPSTEHDIDAIAAIDRVAFEPFWRMGAAGLTEALKSTRASATLILKADGVAGYAMVGAQWGTAYLQRLAVVPEGWGRGLGTNLIRGALAWAHRHAASKMVLNVKPGNQRAIALYERHGFVQAREVAHVYRYAG
ncbi:MAG: GNAT family N-acetyltransferase [Acidimicrobiia bacterium]|nr:GNAT family N-acetyltransferase [Acidimicrobiia bacterium]